MSDCTMPSSPLSGSPSLGVRAEVRPLDSSSSRRAMRSSSPQSKAQVERSLAFKKWAQGRCYRCLAHDHQVNSCRDSFRCIRCRRPGHKEQQCHFRSRPASPRFQPHHPQHTPRRWADVAAKFPSTELRAPLPTPANHDLGSGRNVASCAACGCHCQAGHNSPVQDHQSSVLGPLVESLCLDLKNFFISRLEEVVHPIKAEASIIRLWLARVASHLEHVEPSSKDPAATDSVDLFGPCSPVHRSPTTPFFGSLATDCMETQDSMPHNGHFMAAAEDDVVQSTKECELPTIHETILEPSTPSSLLVQTNEHMETPQDRPMEQLALRVGTTVEEVTTVEDVSKDEVVDSVADTTFEDPVDLIIITDGLTQSAIEAKVELPDESVNATTMKFENLRVVEDVVLVEDASDDEEDLTTVAATDSPTLSLDEPGVEEPQPLDAILLETLPPPNDAIISLSLRTPSTTARRRRKSYDKSSLRRSARLAQRDKLRELGIMDDNGKVDEDVIQDYANHMKELLPPDLLSSLKHVKGRAFRDLLAGISLPLR